MAELDLHAHRGDYGVDGSFDRVPAPVVAAGAGLTAAALAGGAAVAYARGRPGRGSALGILAGSIVGTTALYAHATRAGKFAVWSELLDELGLRGDEHLLDLGCGRGAVLLAAARLLPAGRAVGIDLWRPDQTGNSPQATRRNAELEGVAGRVSVQTADMTRLPFADAEFDVVVSSVAIHNIPSRAGRDAALDEAVRVLRPGGRLVIVDLVFTRHYTSRLRARGLEVRRRNLGWRMWYSGPWLAAHAVTAVRGDRGA